jgi:hypothetical protein
MLLKEIEETTNFPTRGITLKDAILVVIEWCDANPERKIVKISWLFTMRAKHLAIALRY